MSVVPSRFGWARARFKVQALFDDDDPRNRLAWLIKSGLILLVVVSVASIVLETVQDLSVRFGPWFRAIEDVAVAVFTLEYGARLWCAPEHPIYSGRKGECPVSVL